MTYDPKQREVDEAYAHMKAEHRSELCRIVAFASDLGLKWRGEGDGLAVAAKIETFCVCLASRLIRNN